MRNIGVDITELIVDGDFSYIPKQTTFLLSD